jgi:hypothetical protein
MSYSFRGYITVHQVPELIERVRVLECSLRVAIEEGGVWRVTCGVWRVTCGV